MERRIGIVGAGISGVLACKYALSKGFQPIVFELRNTVGGVWTKTAETTKLQTPKSHYQFSDFPWPSSVEAILPSQKQVLEYIQSYAKHFDLMKHIRFNTKVISVTYEGTSEDEIKTWDLWCGNGEPIGNKGKWSLIIEDILSCSTEVIQVDFIVMCQGRFSDVPNIPKFPSGKGPEVFDGKMMHSMIYTEMDNDNAKQLIKGKRVTVVGLQKSALDIAMECSTANGVQHPCTVICRTPHWNLPDRHAWGVPLGYLYFNRFSELLLYKPSEGPLLDLVAALLSPLRWGISKFVESYIKKKHQLEKFNMVPEHSFLQELSTCSISTVPERFYENADKGSIVLKRSPNFRFCKEGVVLDDNGKAKELIVQSDVVILATGFMGEWKLAHIFESKLFQDCILGSSEKIVPLYRQCIHPRIPQMAVIGLSESISSLFTFEMRCRWLFELLDGNFKLPSIKNMEKDIYEWEKFFKRYSGRYFRRSCMGGAHIWYCDQICKDMGLNPNRKKGFWAEWFEPYRPLDYAFT